MQPLYRPQERDRRPLHLLRLLDALDAVVVFVPIFFSSTRLQRKYRRGFPSTTPQKRGENVLYMQKRYFSIEVFSVYSGLSPQLIAEAIEVGALTAGRCSGRWVIDSSDGEMFLTALEEEVYNSSCDDSDDQDGDEEWS